MQPNRSCVLTDAQIDQILSGRRACPTIFDLDRLQRALAGQAPLSQREAWVRRHLDACAECKRQYEELFMLDKAATAAVARVVGEGITNPPPGRVARIAEVA